LEEDHPTLRPGGGQDVPSYKAAVKQRLINDDVSSYKIKDWSRIHNPSLFQHVNQQQKLIGGKSYLPLKL
jgi:hypothetical protein